MAAGTKRKGGTGGGGGLGKRAGKAGSRGGQPPRPTKKQKKVLVPHLMHTYTAPTCADTFALQTVQDTRV